MEPFTAIFLKNHKEKHREKRKEKYYLAEMDLTLWIHGAWGWFEEKPMVLPFDKKLQLVWRFHKYI